MLSQILTLLSNTLSLSSKVTLQSKRLSIIKLRDIIICLAPLYNKVLKLNLLYINQIIDSSILITISTFLNTLISVPKLSILFLTPIQEDTVVNTLLIRSYNISTTSQTILVILLNIYIIILRTNVLKPLIKVSIAYFTPYLYQSNIRAAFQLTLLPCYPYLYSRNVYITILQ